MTRRNRQPGLLRTGLLTAALCVISSAGCATVGSSRHASVAGLAGPLAGDPDHLVSLATSSGMVWPLTVGGLVAILAAIVAWFVGSRSSAVGLLIIGIVICVAPIFLMDVLTHLSIPLAIILGIAGVASLAYYLGALWQRWSYQRRLAARADFIEDTANYAELTAGSVGRVLRNIDRKDFDARKKIK